MNKEKTYSVNDLSNLSLFEIIILQLLLQHSKSVVRHALYLEVNQFLQNEEFKKKKINSDITGSEASYYSFLRNQKMRSTSSFYNSLDNLNKLGFVTYVKNEKVKFNLSKKMKKPLKQLKKYNNNYFAQA